jgi:hypothetical protein
MKKWKGTMSKEFAVTNEANGNCFIHPKTGAAIARVYTENEHRYQAQANANLFVDALTTVQKCDLLPSELLKQRDILLVQLKSVLAHKSITEWLTDSRPEHEEDANTLSRMFTGIDQLIKSIEG